MRALLIGLLIVTVILILPGGASAQTPTASPSTSVAAGFPAIISISLQIMTPAAPPSAPQPEAAYADIKITLEVSGFKLVDRKGESNVPGEGHIIYYWAHPPTFPLSPAYSGPDTYSESVTSTTFTWNNWNLSERPYGVFSAQLVNNDDTPLNPPVYAEIVTNLPFPGQAPDKPVIYSMSLNTTAPSTPPASPLPDLLYMDAVVKSRIAGLELVPASSRQNNAPGQGHFVYTQWVDPIVIPGYYVTLDGNYTYSTSISPFTFLNINPDYFSYSVQLVNNDDSAFDLSFNSMFPVFSSL